MYWYCFGYYFDDKQNFSITLKFFQQMKKIVSLSFKKYGEAELAQFATNVVNRMKADPQFVSLMPHVEVLSACDTAFDLAVSNALLGGTQLTKEKNRKMEELKNQLEVVAIYIEGLAKENEDVVLAAGYEVKKAAEPITDINEPTALKVMNEDRSGSVKVSWETVAGAINYGVERKIGDSGVWQNGDYSSAKSTVITGLPPGSYVSFQVRAYARKGLVSGWSQEVGVWVS
jgi:hypothetical protein